MENSCGVGILPAPELANTSRVGILPAPETSKTAIPPAICDPLMSLGLLLIPLYPYTLSATLINPSRQNNDGPCNHC